MTASLIFAFWNAVAKNFAEPSGSSPAENPPGNMIICAWSIAFVKSLHGITDIFCCQVLEYFDDQPLHLHVRNARVLSYSQFVPGNTGINTRRFCNFMFAYINVFCIVYRSSFCHASSLSSPDAVCEYSLQSSFPCFVSCFFHVITSIAVGEFTASSVTSPITCIGNGQVLRTLSAGTSADDITKCLVQRSLLDPDYARSSHPVLLPNAILLTAAAIP